MIIENTSSFELFLGFIDHGFSLKPGEQKDIPETVTENETFQQMENLGQLTIISYESDPTRLATRQELDPTLDDHETRITTLEGGGGGGNPSLQQTIDKFTGESLSPGQVFSNILSNAPADTNKVKVYINGIADFDISISGQVVTWGAVNEYSISPTDEIVFEYFK